MESVSQSIPVPAIVALVTGFVLLRAWPSAKVKTPDERLPSPASPDRSQEASQSVSKESDFPENWWSGKDVFELERRAVFSKVYMPRPIHHSICLTPQTWIPILPRARFTKPGDYHSIEVAGFPIFLMLGKDGRMRAFHNVCRHRAYTVTRREAGSSTVLGCRYHGWTYNTYGQLVKAPQFDNVPGFDKAQNGLFEIHTQVSECGFVFVNLDAGQVVWEPGASAVLDGFASRNGFGRESSWVGGETLEGTFNWKLGCELFKTALGRLVLTPEGMLVRFLDNMELESSMAALANGSLAAKVIRYFKRQEADDVAVYPNASFHTIRDTELLYSLSFLPSSEQKTLIRYDLFSRGGNTVDPRISENLKGLLNGSIRGLEREYQFHVSKTGYAYQARDALTRLMLNSQSALNASTDLASGGTALYTCTRIHINKSQTSKSNSSTSSRRMPSWRRLPGGKCFPPADCRGQTNGSRWQISVSIPSCSNI